MEAEFVTKGDRRIAADRVCWVSVRRLPGDPTPGEVRMPWWVSRFGLTWASAMVLVTAGVVQAFEAAGAVKQRQEAGELLRGERAVEVVAPRPAQRIHRVERVKHPLEIGLSGAHDGAVVELRVSGCSRDGVRMTRRAHSFPVKVFDVDPDDTCTVQARRRDGIFWTRWTPPVRTRGASELTLALPDRRAGGVGLRIEAVPQGARILDVLPMTPAWRAGLEPGQIVHSADGQRLAGLPVDALIERITGPEGSRAELAVVDPRTGRTIHHAVPRVFMD